MFQLDRAWHSRLSNTFTCNLCVLSVFLHASKKSTLLKVCHKTPALSYDEPNTGGRHSLVRIREELRRLSGLSSINDLISRLRRQMHGPCCCTSISACLHHNMTGLSGSLAPDEDHDVALENAGWSKSLYTNTSLFLADAWSAATNGRQGDDPSTVKRERQTDTHTHTHTHRERGGRASFEMRTTTRRLR